MRHRTGGAKRESGQGSWTVHAGERVCAGRMRCHRIHIMRPIQDLKSISIQALEGYKLMAGSSFLGLDCIETTDLMDLKKAIDTEVSHRREKQAQNMEIELNAHLRQILSSGNKVIISTDTDEIIVTPDELTSICIEVFPLT